MKREYPEWLAALALLTGLSGCGGRLYPVEGQVMWADGQPATELAGGMVFFESAEHRTISRASIQADGRFRLTTSGPAATVSRLGRTGSTWSSRAPARVNRGNRGRRPRWTRASADRRLPGWR